MFHWKKLERIYFWRKNEENTCAVLTAESTFEFIIHGINCWHKQFLSFSHRSPVADVTQSICAANLIVLQRSRTKASQKEKKQSSELEHLVSDACKTHTVLREPHNVRRNKNVKRRAQTILRRRQCRKRQDCLHSIVLASINIVRWLWSVFYAVPFLEAERQPSIRTEQSEAQNKIIRDHSKRQALNALSHFCARFP